MIDSEGELIYVGKAKNLRVRLLSYFRRKSRVPKAGRILSQTRMVLWEILPSEFAALHRELELIRRWRPRWNVQGQPLRRLYSYLCLGRRPAPYLFLTRKPVKKILACFGPLPWTHCLREAVRRLNDLFQLRDCPEPVESYFSDQQNLIPVPTTPACLRHELGNCLAPCAALCSTEQYERQTKLALDFLRGNFQKGLKVLEKAMANAARDLQFERAASLRDRLENLTWLAKRLEKLAKAKKEGNFIYPLGPKNSEIWYVIHGGRTVAAFPSPKNLESAQTISHQIEDIYHRNHARSLEVFEHVDGFVIVQYWFQKYPKELSKILTPESALKKCKQFKSLS